MAYSSQAKHLMNAAGLRQSQFGTYDNGARHLVQPAWRRSAFTLLQLALVALGAAGIGLYLFPL